MQIETNIDKKAVKVVHVTSHSPLRRSVLANRVKKAKRSDPARMRASLNRVEVVSEVSNNFSVMNKVHDINKYVNAVDSYFSKYNSTNDSMKRLAQAGIIDFEGTVKRAYLKNMGLK